MTTIYLNRDDAEQVQAAPLWWQGQGLQYTASGYGTCFVMLGKEKQIVDF